LSKAACTRLKGTNQPVSDAAIYPESFVAAEDWMDGSCSVRAAALIEMLTSLVSADPNLG
jgi:hypothetical protein